MTVIVNGYSSVAAWGTKVLISVRIDQGDDLVKVDYSTLRTGTLPSTGQIVFFGPKFAVIPELSNKEWTMLVMEESNVFATGEKK